MLKASDVVLDKRVEKFAVSYANSLKKRGRLNRFNAVDFSPPSRQSKHGVVEVPEEYLDCLDKFPKDIRDLKDGVTVDIYSFKRGDESKLSLMGFFDISVSNNEKITVVEYSQFGSIICNRKRLRFGVGCRLMLRVISQKRGAKLNTPQQITASVIFGKAEVNYSMQTFGITGPGVGGLNQAGAVTEDTYNKFVTEVSNMIVKAYDADSRYIINPQPLFLKKN
jgi:hypothetical protein